jgi:molybdopterin adenylyltransferase
MRAAVLTISSSRAAGQAHDESGPLLERLARAAGALEVTRDLVSDQRESIEQRLRSWADEGYALVLTSGGTGMSPEDVTPEATSSVLEREAPGIAEAIRLASMPHTDMWMLSRGVAGVRGETLIVNLPGNPRSIVQVGDALSAGLRHALALISPASQGPPDRHPHGCGEPLRGRARVDRVV